jgi:hypothetical protein
MHTPSRRGRRERDRQHPARDIVLRAAEVEACLHAARTLDRELRLRQVDPVRGEHELRLRRERVNSSAIELSLTPACTKNAGTLGMPTSIV